MRTLDEDNKAWNILSNDEKTALKLNLGLSKSTWQASEIMAKSHYKYLEILGRAKKIFKIFSEHFEMYNDVLIPEDIGLESDFESFIESVIIYRMKVREASLELKNKDYRNQSSRNEMIVKNMQYLQSLSSIQADDTYCLIKEFDRWNNFRILPDELQEPHAFKRRNKKRIQKYINNLLNLEPWVITTIKQNYSLKNSNGTSLYFALPVRNRMELSEIIHIKRDDVAIQRFTDAGLFLFTIPDHAMEFLTIVTDYFGKSYKHCKDGQIFWPRLRVIIQKAINFNDIERMVPGRKILETAAKNLDQIKVNNYQKRNS